MKKRLALCLFITVSILGVVARYPSAKAEVSSDKISVEEILAKHLESIGKPEARKAGRSRVIAGTTRVTFRSRGIATADGGAVLASADEMSMITMKFESSQYPYEKIGFDGKKVTAYQLHPGDYSSLGNFTRSFPEIFKEGLMGGTLSSAWPLLDFSSKRAKLEFAGTRKINSRDLLVIKYSPHGGSDLNITLFFDSENFQHVRTVYERTISGQMGRTPEQSAAVSATHYELVEEFADFKTESGLTLPHTYKIHLGQQGSATQVSDWTMSLVRFVFNQKLDARDFDVSSD